MNTEPARAGSLLGGGSSSDRSFQQLCTAVPPNTRIDSSIGAQYKRVGDQTIGVAYAHLHKCSVRRLIAKNRKRPMVILPQLRDLFGGNDGDAKYLHIRMLRLVQNLLKIAPQVDHERKVGQENQHGHRSAWGTL